MSQLMVRCEDCGSVNDYTALRQLAWRCPDCQSFLMPPPTQKQINYAVSLGINEPEKMSAEELGPLISAKKSELDEEARRLKENLLSEASATRLIQELETRGIEFIMLAERGRVKPAELALFWTQGYAHDALQTVTQYALLAAKGEIPVVPRNGQPATA